ncbi:hypothetical protein [Magnetospirillum sp. 64-120]|uniref:hypothetical protein n=1 Tax=Magnetospirillum sp. 64-120 TaxID=1895778 RepID=UPI0025C2D928|nr:hypothetical protein [Magnetospirillum sp. 64-120]
MIDIANQTPLSLSVLAHCMVAHLRGTTNATATVPFHQPIHSNAAEQMSGHKRMLLESSTLNHHVDFEQLHAEAAAFSQKSMNDAAASGRPPGIKKAHKTP